MDDSKGHGGAGTAETEAEGRLVTSAGRANVLRQHMGDLQHNKTISVNGPTVVTLATPLARPAISDVRRLLAPSG